LGCLVVDGCTALIHDLGEHDDHRDLEEQDGKDEVVGAGGQVVEGLKQVGGVGLDLAGFVWVVH